MELVAIEAQHGPDCTCPVTMHIALTLVAATPGCPGDPVRYTGSRISQQIDDTPPLVDGPPIVITWPESHPTRSLLAWDIAIHDHATGRQLIDVVSMRIQLGGDNRADGPIEAELVRFLDHDGLPVSDDGPARPIARDDSGQLRTGRFRCPVVGMRTAPGGRDDAFELRRS